MSRSALDLLEFAALLDLLRRQTTCAPGRRAVESLAPHTDRALLDTAYAHIREAMAWLRAGRDLGFGSLADPDPWLAKLDAPAAVLAPAELLDAASLLDTVTSLRQTFKEDAAKFPLLSARASSLADFRSLAAAIRRAILPNGDIADDASSELRRIRTQIARTRDSIQKTLQQLLRDRGEEPGEDYVTRRNDRFVIPVRAAARREVRGVVHGASATGQTLFVEPLETIEHNNRLVQLVEDEAAEIARILAELTARLQSDLGPLRHAAATIADLDSLFARARFAHEFDCALPEFTDSFDLRLDSARHPVLEARLRAEARPIVPITLALGSAETVLVISGPNTGGKTVALKTVGLAALAAQSAIPVAAQSAVLPLFDRVLADIGDEQSIAADLSTFSAHVLNLRSMLGQVTPHSLVLVDEIGTGTAPEEGSALAVALLEEFLQRRCLTLATTHHDRLKAWASSTSGVLNAAVEFDEVNLRPTYRLLVGVPGTSSGIAIARRLGLSVPLIDRAQKKISPEAREASALIAFLHRSRDELEEIKRNAAEQLRLLEDERRKLQTEWVDRQKKRLADLEHKFAEAAKRYETEIRRLVEEIKDRELRAQMEKSAGRRGRKVAADARDDADAAVVQHLSDSQADLGPSATPPPTPPSPDQLLPGTRVRVRGLPSPVTILALSAVGARHVEAGSLPAFSVAPASLPAGARGRAPLDTSAHGGSAVGARHGVPAQVEHIETQRAAPSSPSSWAEVQAGPLRMRVPLSDILSLADASPSSGARHASRPLAPDASAPSRSAVGARHGVPSSPASLVAPASLPAGARGRAPLDPSVHPQSSAESAADELNVIGLTVEEATARVDKFLDDAALRNASRVRIIHGHGTGALRRGLAAFLTGHPHVASFALADPDHGGSAITLVELKS